MAETNYLEKFKGLSKKEMAEAVSKDLASKKKKVKELEDDISQLKDWLRDYAATQRVDNDIAEVEEVNVFGTKVHFKRPTPTNFDEETAKIVKARFVEVLEDGNQVFKELFEKKVEFKPRKGFADNYFGGIAKTTRKRLDNTVPWKGNKAQIT